MFAVHPPLADYINNSMKIAPSQVKPFAVRAMRGIMRTCRRLPSHEAIATSPGCCYAVPVRIINDRKRLLVLQRTYDWTIRLAGHRHALLTLAAVAFIESSIFPIPPDVLLLPMILAARQRAWLIAGVATAASVAGGLAGYGIGYFLFEEIGRPLLEFYGYQDKFEIFRGYYHEWGAWIVAGAGLTPCPYKVITIASGVAALDLTTFTIASVLSRGARFFLVAALLWYFGPPIRAFIEKNLAMVTTAFFVLLFGGFVVARFLM